MQMVVPVWFVGHQLPEDLRSRKGKPAASVNSVDDKDADNECDDDNTGTKKRKRNCNSRKVSNKKVSRKQSTKSDQLSVDTNKGTENIAQTSDRSNIERCAEIMSIDTIEDGGYAADMDIATATSDTGITECCTENTTNEDNWEVSGFSSNGGSSDEWTPDK